jgi:hypothetical protein
LSAGAVSALADCAFAAKAATADPASKVRRVSADVSPFSRVMRGLTIFPWSYSKHQQPGRILA